MRVIGVDLAWGPRGRTGLCAAEAGRALDSATVRTDDEIDAWIGRWGTRDRDVIVAIDAPLIVPNAAGRRPCERVFCSAMAQRQAGVYPAHLRACTDAMPSSPTPICGKRPRSGSMAGTIPGTAGRA